MEHVFFKTMDPHVQVGCKCHICQKQLQPYNNKYMIYPYVYIINLVKETIQFTKYV